MIFKRFISKFEKTLSIGTWVEEKCLHLGIAGNINSQIALPSKDMSDMTYKSLFQWIVLGH